MSKSFTHTATIALDGDELVIGFETIGLEGKLSVHSVRVPFTLKGLSIIRTALLHRSQPTTRTVGTKGAPIQHMITEWLRANPTPKKQPKKPISLADLGL